MLFKKNSKLKSIVKDISRPLIAHVFDEQTILRAKYAKMYDTNQVKAKTILYETRDGQSIGDSPYAIFKYLVTHPAYEDYHHYWSIEKDDELIKDNIFEYKEFENVHFIIRNSKEYLRWITSAKIVITNATFQSYYVKQKNQTYINTWHGTPLKHMGFDIPGNPAHSQNVLRNFFMTDYIISPNAHTTEILKNSYRLNKAYTGSILEGGYPRIDLTINSEETYVINKLQRYGINIDVTKKTLIYMPTWTGENISAPQNDIQQIVEEINFLRTGVGDEYNILVKVHPYVYPYICDSDKIQKILVPNYLDANEMLSISDILITDYSSVFFDFLVTKKPIIFYSWNKELYEQDRGTYIPIDELPGPTAENIRDVITILHNRDTIMNTYQAKYNKMRLELAKYDDGKSTERYISKIFGNVQHDENNLKEVRLYQPLKKLLIYPGGMKNNGITSSLINLTNNIDYNKYDVTIFMQTTKNWNEEILNNLNKISSNVRFVFKPGKPIFTVVEAYKDLFLHKFPGGVTTRLASPEKLYSRETKRLLGMMKYDVAIDFSGYSFYWGKYIVAANVKKKIVFQHNDLLADAQKEVAGEHIHATNLKGLFHLYRSFDDLVSVSKATMKINRRKLSDYAEKEKFKYSVNTINPTTILQSSNHRERDVSEAGNWDIKKNKYSAIFNTKTPIFLFENWDDIFLNTPQTIAFDQHAGVRVVAELELENHSLAKILVDDIYRGWVFKNKLTRIEDKIISELEFNEIGRIVWPGNHIVWSNPYNTEKESYRIMTAKSLRGVYVNIKKEVITTRAKYYHIFNGDNVIGWIDARAIAIKATYTQWIKTKYFEYKMKKVNADLEYKLNKNTLNYKNVNDYGVLSLLERDSIWEKPFGCYGNTLSRYSKKNYNHKNVNIIQEATTRRGTYALCEYRGQEIGWIDRRRIKNDSTSIQQNIEQVQWTVSLVTDKEVFHIWDVLPQKDTTPGKVYNTNQTYQAVEIVTTNTGVYVKIKTELITLGYIEREVINIIEDKTLKDIDGNTINPIDSSYVNFITMGRLSPEKNHAELLRAFAKIKIIVNKKVRLYILGSGALEQELRKMIKDLNIEDCVILLGQRDNPFVIMKQCDYFILPSLYEGQPMVLLEALTLGLPIIASDIPANRYVLQDGALGTLIRGTKSDAIIKGIQELLDKPRKAPLFDYETYNNKAIDEFYSLVE